MGVLEALIELLLGEAPVRGLELDDASGLEETERIEVRGEVTAHTIRVDERPYARRLVSDRRRQRDATVRGLDPARRGRRELRDDTRSVRPVRGLRDLRVAVSVVAICATAVRLLLIPEHRMPRLVDRLRLCRKLVADFVEETQGARKLEDIAHCAHDTR